MRVLVLDSNLKDAEFLAEVVQSNFDFQVDLITSDIESLNWVRVRSYNIVIFSLCDRFRMEHLDRIRRMDSGIGIIVLSNLESVREAVSVMRLGAIDYLKKPVHSSELETSLRRAIDSEVIFSINKDVYPLMRLIGSCQVISGVRSENEFFEALNGFFYGEMQLSYSVVFRREKELKALYRFFGPSDRASGLSELIDAFAKKAVVEPWADSKRPYLFIEKTEESPALFVYRFDFSGEKSHFFIGLAPIRPRDVNAFESRLRILGRQVELADKNLQRVRGAQRLALTDHATGLYNTRFLNQVIDQKIKSYQETKSEFAVLFADLDFFKKINDQYGHLVGTKILNELAEILRLQTREGDAIVRYGGDEFVVVLQNCKLDRAKRVAERIRAAVEDHSFLKDTGKPIRLTMSVGVALFPKHAKTREEIIAVADKVMYEAKRSRNSVYVAKTKRLSA